jgi:hypothetical protein
MYDSLGSQHDRALFGKAYYAGQGDALGRLEAIKEEMNRYDIPGPVNKPKSPSLRKKIIGVSLGKWVDDNGVIHDQDLKYVQLPVEQ